MPKNGVSFLQIGEVAGWQNSCVVYHAICVCGKRIKIERRRTKGQGAYISCGCARDPKSKTYFYNARRSFFNRINKVDSHWIYQTLSKQKVVICKFNGIYFSIQRLAYMLWHHMNPLGNDSFEDNINTVCGVRECVCPWHLRALNNADTMKLLWFNKRILDGKNK